MNDRILEKTPEKGKRKRWGKIEFPALCGFDTIERKKKGDWNISQSP